MDLVNHTGMEVGWIVTKLTPPLHSLTVFVKGTFDLNYEQPAQLAEEQIALTGDEHEEDNPARPLRYGMDFSPIKPHTDLIVYGEAYAPGDKAVTNLQATFKIGSFSKTLNIFGDRYWETRNRTSTPIPFTHMPLSWEKAFGGPDFPENPLGKGLKKVVHKDGSKVHPLPNIEASNDVISTRAQKVKPSGFGPIPEDWSQRSKKFGKITSSYLKERWPWYPEDIDWSYFNCAPEDQQLIDFLVGDEKLLFENLHPNIPRYTSRLPQIRVRCFLNEKVRAHQELREILMNIDTLWVNPGKEQLILVWRGNIAIRSEKLIHIHHLFATKESLSQELAQRERIIAVFHDALVLEEMEDEEFEPEEPAEEEPTNLTTTAEEELTLSDAEGDESDIFQVTEQSTPGLIGATNLLRGEPQVDSFDVGTASPDQEGKTDKKNLIQSPSDLHIPSSTTPTPDRTNDLAQIEEEAPLTIDIVRKKITKKESFNGCDLTGLILANLDFQGLDLRNTILEGAVLINVNLSHADLSGANLGRANLRQANCTNAVFIEADLTEAWLVQANLKGAKLLGADFSKANLRQAVLSNAQAAETIFEEADLTYAKFISTDLSGADLCHTLLHHTDFTHANLSEVAFEGAWGRQVKASGANMYKVRGANSIFCEADFEGVKGEESVWEFAQLCLGKFSAGDFCSAEFSGANLFGTIFEAVNLKDARLNGANLHRAVLKRANLFNVSFSGADLTRADFTESNLYGANLMDSLISQTLFSGANMHQIKTNQEIS